MKSLALFLTLVYYSISIPYIYCNFLTAKKNIKYPFTICFFIILPNAFLILMRPDLSSFTILISMVLSLFVFNDPWLRRISGLIIAYCIQLMGEFIGTDLTHIILYFITGKMPNCKLIDAVNPSHFMLAVCLIIIVGILMLCVLIPLMRKGFRYLQTSTIALLGLPLILTMIIHNILSIQLNLEQFRVYLPISCIICLGCYIPLAIGLRNMRHQALIRNNNINQRILIEKQLDYSQQLEDEYTKLRKWNHDIDNHFVALSYLLGSHQYEECMTYLEALLDIKEMNPTSSEKT